MTKEQKKEKKTKNKSSVFDDNFFSGTDINDNDRVMFELSPSLDIVLGGGLMSGQIVELSGQPKIGKSTCALTWAKDAIKKGYHVYILDVEQRLRKSLLDIIGLDTNHLTVIKSIESNILMGEQYLEVLDNLIKDKEKSFFIVDSVPALRFEDGALGALAREMTKFVRMSSAVVDVKNHCVVLLSHEKKSINVGGYGPRTYTPGGDHIQFQSSTIMSVRKMATLKKNDTGVPYGHTVLFKIKCSPTTGPCECKLNLKYGYGFDIDDDVLQLALELGVIEMNGAWLTIEGEKVQGKETAIQYIAENDLKETILKKCYELCEV